jgi:nucleoside-diphosphate-sugar epimerase
MHLARHFVGAGSRTRVIDVASRPAWVSELGVDYVQGDVRDACTIRRVLSAADAVVHAAFAPPRAGPSAMRDVNVGGTASVCAEAMAIGVRRVVVVSSTIVERSARSPGVLRRSPLVALNAYRSTRAEAEAVALRYEQKGLSVAIVRPKTFLGPERISAFALILEQIRRGQVVPLPGSGSNRYQLLDVRDFAAGLDLLTRHAGTGVYWFGASEYSTVAEDLQTLIDHAATGARLRPLPPRVLRACLRVVELIGLPPLSDWYQCGVRAVDSVVDASRARAELGWEPTRSNAQSLIDSYDWYRSCRDGGGLVPATHSVPRGHRAMRAVVSAVLRNVKVPT